MNWAITSAIVILAWAIHPRRKTARLPNQHTPETLASMILDDLQLHRRYEKLHPGFAAAFLALQDPGLAFKEPGRYAIDGKRLSLIIGKEAGRGREGAKLEAHRRFIDIQFMIAGDEEMGWRTLSECKHVTKAYSEDDDLMFFGDAPESWFSVPPGKFTIFFPDDAHAPLAGHGQLHKAVMKIAVDW